MSNLVFIFETMECDWDSYKIIRGVFSDAKEAVEYIKNNYYLVDDEHGRDVCITDYPIKGVVFSQHGYEAHHDDVFYDDEDNTYFTTYETDEGDYTENLNTQTIFTLRGVILDELLC